MCVVATVLTVYGIETTLSTSTDLDLDSLSLQQYLPFTVLKLAAMITPKTTVAVKIVATVLTVYGIETS